jgi:ribonuclease PH
MLLAPSPRSQHLTREDGRRPDQLRPCIITPNVLDFAEGSALIEMGRTRVLCAVSVEDRVPAFLRGAGKGWITAEYSMLPRATNTRSQRESVAGRIGGRTHEIQRLIGRSVRSVANLPALGERTLTIDCDVLQADGGTRTAAITGAYVAVAIACARLRPPATAVTGAAALADLAVAAATSGPSPTVATGPLRQAVAAVSAGIVDQEVLLDLAYGEDSRAEVDFNLVMTEDGRLVEVQGTAEGEPFTRAQLDQIVDRAAAGIRELFALQKAALIQAGVSL